MQPITFDSICYRAGGQPIYLLSGEFHYFRVPKADWRTRMGLFKQAGGNCLATYIPWLLHEPREGQFHFSGEDWLDLEGFLQTAQEEGLYVIARPGPYQYSELVYHGLPGWLVQDYPEVLAQTMDGKPIAYASVSYTHPLFLEKVRRWFDAVLPILARYTLSQGGPVAFTQIDNELVGIHEWFGSLDYHPVSMGIGQAAGKYPAFLEQRYENLDALNQAYHTAYTAFTEVSPKPTAREGVLAKADAVETAAAAVRRKKDYFDFYLSTIADYAQELTRQIRKHGIDTPIMHNSGNPGMNAYFIETAAALGGDFMLGSDHYYNLDQTWPQNNPTPQYAARVFLSLEMLRLMGYPPSVLEMPGGSCSDWPPITPGDALAAYQTNLAFGMKGCNYYIFTGGPNPPGAGQTTDLYDYSASIGANGEIRPLYEAQKSFGAFVQSHPDWLTAERQADFRLGLDFEYARSEQYWSERGPFLFSNLDAWGLLRKGMLTSALCASLSPRFIDLAGVDWVNDTSTPLAVASSVSMSRTRQQNLVDYLKNGGRLVVAPLLPQFDENLQPCTLLADFLGGPVQTANTAGLSRPRIQEVVNVHGTIFPLDSVPEGAQVVGVDEFSGKPIALSMVTPGGGQVTLLGLSWTHAMREHERMWASVLNSLGLEPVVQCSNPNLWATLYTAERRAVLFVMNLFTAPSEADLKARVRPGGEMIDFGHLSAAPVTVSIMEREV